MISMQPQYITPSNHVKDIAGQRFDRLLVLGYLGISKNGSAIWRCQCDCGNIVDVVGHSIRSGHAKSCGCLSKESTSERFTTHGMSGTSAHIAWSNMLQRCQNPINPNYSNYGGRGVTVCDRWQEFENFFADMGEPPAGMSLDRKDNDGNYDPDNCRWTTNQQQAINKRSNQLLTLDGRTMPMMQWASETGIKANTIWYRLDRGWTVEDALTKPVQKSWRDNRTITFDGRTMTTAQWSQETGIGKKTIRTRLNRGWTVKDALTRPVQVQVRNGAK
jgi:hypothetical protein